jgi:hypothetical protein
VVTGKALETRAPTMPDGTGGQSSPGLGRCLLVHSYMVVGHVSSFGQWDVSKHKASRGLKSTYPLDWPFADLGNAATTKPTGGCPWDHEEHRAQ